MARGILTRPIEDLGPRGWFFLLLSSAIAQLLLITADRFYGREYRNGSLFLLAAVALAIVFFRKRKIALAICGLSYYTVMAGLTVPFHPSLLAWGLAIGSAASLYNDRSLVREAISVPLLQTKAHRFRWRGRNGCRECSHRGVAPRADKEPPIRPVVDPMIYLPEPN